VQKEKSQKSQKKMSKCQPNEIVKIPRGGGQFWQKNKNKK
jgi:hypothetical protein